MNAINENMSAEAAKKHNPRIPYIAAAHMGRSMMDLMLQELKAAPDVWQKMNAQQQSEVIERFRLRIQYAIAGAVNTVVTGGHIALAGTIDSIAKKDKIKLTVIIDRNNNSDAMHEFYLADSGAACQILMADAGQYCGGMDVIEAESDQGALFGNEPELPDDQLLWAINVPMLHGSGMAPAPSRKDAELYARSIREKLIELDRTEYAISVYALPWPMNRGEHMRQYNNGNWDSLVSWLSQLCAGEVEVKPVALIGHSPDEFEDVVDASMPEVDYKPTDGFALIDPIQPEAAADDHIKIYFEPSSKFLTVQGRTTTQPSKAQALRCGKAVMFGAKDCMFEYTGSEKIGNMLCETYEARLLIELTEEQPRIKVSYSPINGGVYRATCNTRSSTSTYRARGAVDNLLKKMGVAGEVVEITTLDDIERDAQMFTVI